MIYWFTFLKTWFCRLLLWSALFLPLSGYSQQFVLNQDFSNAYGTTPPLGWQNITLMGNEVVDLWHFDNPGGQNIPLPMVQPFAMFDAGSLSRDNGPEKVALQTRPFDASISNYFLLMFDHVFSPGVGELASVEANLGGGWRHIVTFDEEISNPRYDILDISPTDAEIANVGGLENAMVRFVWYGDGQGFWALDNVRIYQASDYDAALLAISAPVMPFLAGEHQIRITLGNYGLKTLQATTIHWEVNGMEMEPLIWNGALSFGQREENILLGTYDFQGPVTIRVWQSKPNGENDSNPYNDELTMITRPALAGEYAIGGEEPDFENFKEAVDAINIAGVSGAVRFVVRPGIYDNQITIGQIDGATAENRIVFESENGNPESTQLVFGEWLQTTMRLRDSRYIYFRNIGFFGGYNGLIIEDQASDISFEGCILSAGFNVAVTIRGGARHILMKNNIFHKADSALVIGQSGFSEVHHIHVIGNTFGSIRQKAIQLFEAKEVIIADNFFDDVRIGIVSYHSEQLTIRNNRIHVLGSYGYQTAGIEVRGGDQSIVYNNFVYARGLASSTGIRLKNTRGVNVFFNSLNMLNTDAGSESKALWIDGGNQLNAKNNILNIEEKGFPIVLEGSPIDLQLDYNNYHNPLGIIGRHERDTYFDLEEWMAAFGQDANSLVAYPFFTSADDPSINQVLLNNVGLAIDGIDTDIDGKPRSTIEPDIGAWEYDLCGTDAGVNKIISPPSPVEPGVLEVWVELQNQGVEVLNDVIIIWSVNGVIQGQVLLNNIGLESGQNMEVALGLYDFPRGFHNVRAWTSLADDCNDNNDSVEKMIMVTGALCGDYYIGNQADDHFNTFSEAVLVLNTSGIGHCSVRFIVRGGIYEEQVVIADVKGTSEMHTITFEADPDDDTPVQLHYTYEDQTPIRLTGSRYVIFKGIEFNGHYAMVIENQSSNIVLEDCLFLGDDVLRPLRPALSVRGGSGDIVLRGNTLIGGLQSVRLEQGDIPVRNVGFFDNLFAGAVSAAISMQMASNVEIAGNSFDKVSRGVYAVDASDLSIWGNRIRTFAMYGVENVGLDIKACTRIRIYNNYILGQGLAASIGIRLNDSKQSGVFFNSINMAFNDPEGSNKAFWLIEGADHIVKNNIFVVRYSGDPMHLQGPASQVAIDYNNYYSSRDRIGRHNQTTYSNLSEWRAMTLQDGGSLSENPFFPVDEGGDVDLSMNQVLLKNTGISIDWISIDIDHTLRDEENPDMGAKEYDLCAADAGVNAIVSPGSIVEAIPGGQELIVMLRNHGSNHLYSAELFLSITGAGVNEEFKYEWEDAVGIPGGSSVEVVFENRFEFLNGMYRIKAWTAWPNGLEDCNTHNDTTEITIASSLCGDAFTIGGTDADFLNLAEAAFVLNTAGISCPVVFYVRDGVYDERFLLGNIPGADSNNTVTFMAEHGLDGNVSLSPDAGEQAAVILRDAHHVHFHHIGFNGQSAIVIDNQSSNISFDGCSFSARRIAMVLKGGSSQVSVVNSLFASGIGHSKTDNFIVIHGDEKAFVEHVEIKDNVFISPTYQAIYASAARHLFIEGNRFEEIQMGIYAYNTRHIVINDNWFHIITIPYLDNMGVFINGGDDSRIYNNFIRSSGTHPVYGISLSNTRHSGVFFNTMNIRNSHVESKALLLHNGLATVVKNNIFEVFRGFPVYIDGPSDGLNLDYNNYFNPLGLVGYLGSNISNFELWKSMIFGDSNSSFLDPLFASDANPLPHEKFLNGAGITIQGITHDIYDNPRFEPPDMGCMEFFIDYGIAGLKAPRQECLLSDTETISVVIQKYGDVLLEDFEIAVQLNDGDVYIEKISGDFHGTYTHTFSTTFDFSEYGTHNLAVWLPNIRDDNPNNDRDEFILVSPEPLAITYEATDQLCIDGNDGQVKMTISGGIPPYSVSLDGMPHDVIQGLAPFAIENLAPATYTLSVKDDIGCDISLMFEIAPAVPMAPIVMASKNEGIVPFQIEFFFDVNEESLMDSWLWRVGTLTETTRNPTFTFDREGVHEIILEVFSGPPGYCMEQASYSVLAELEELVVGVDIQPQLCVDGDLGSVTLTIVGGIPPFIVVFNDDEPQETEDRVMHFSDLQSGPFTIHTTDAYFEAQEMTITGYLDSPLEMNPQIEPISGGVIIQTPVEFSFGVNNEVDLDNYIWRVGSLTSTMRRPEFIFDQLGEHTLELTVFSGYPGYCSETTTYSFVVELDVMELSSDPYPQRCIYHDLASIVISIVGGTPPFMIAFNEEGTVSTNDRRITFSNLQPGLHRIVVQDAYGQIQSHIEDLPDPIVMNPVIHAADDYGRVYQDTIYGVIPFEVWFSFSANEMPVTNTWFYDDQVDGYARVHPITFNQEGELKVTLEVGSGDPYQCVETTEFVIISERKVVITPVEVITPNGGGPNEYFEVISKGLLSLKVDIFDRRGRRVHGYDGLDGRWYGNYENEKEAPDGMYPFFLSGMGFDNHKYEQSGLIRLIRETANLFPNPASQSVNIDIGNTMSAPLNIEIIDYRGNRVFFDRRDDLDILITLDVSGLMEGIYLVRFSDGDHIMNKKLWIARP